MQANRKKNIVHCISCNIDIQKMQCTYCLCFDFFPCRSLINQRNAYDAQIQQILYYNILNGWATVATNYINMLRIYSTLHDVHSLTDLLSCSTQTIVFKVTIINCWTNDRLFWKCCNVAGKFVWKENWELINIELGLRIDSIQYF